jgi:hypothetical protein
LAGRSAEQAERKRRTFRDLEARVSHRRLNGERLAIHTARGSSRGPEFVKRTILANPELIEAGFFPLDAHLRAGNGGLIDLLAVDGAGTLAVLEIDRDGEEHLLRRSLEHQGWIATQIPFLRRLYGGERILPFRSPRAILLARRFSRPFLDRIAELPTPITPLLYRLAVSGDTSSLRLEPAAPAPQPVTGDPLLSMFAGMDPLPEIPAPPDFLGLQEIPALEGERLTEEELEAFYRFERQRLDRGKKGALER